MGKVTGDIRVGLGELEGTGWHGNNYDELLDMYAQRVGTPWNPQPDDWCITKRKVVGFFRPTRKHPHGGVMLRIEVEWTDNP